jgi:hypothetical protein
METGSSGNAGGDTSIGGGSAYTLNVIQQRAARATRTNFERQHFLDSKKIFFDVSLIFSNWYYKVCRKSTQEKPCFMRVLSLVHFFAEYGARHCG